MTDFEEFEQQIIELIDEDGETNQFELIDIVEFEGKEYGLLLPVNDEDETLIDNEDEREVVLMRLNKIMSEYVFETIDSEEEFQRVAEYINSFDEEDDEEGEQEGDDEA